MSTEARDVTDPKILRALRGEIVSPPPIWLMRQAGRYLPEFMALFREHGFMKLCRDPALAAEVTLQPVRRFGLDAAILFSDILLVLEAMGAEVAFDAGGPRVSTLLDGPDDLGRLEQNDPVERLGFVAEAVERIVEELPPEVPLIGFAGAPFTLLTYIVEGRGELALARARALLDEEPEVAEKALARLADVVLAQLRPQVRAGARVVQLFDSWTGVLDVERWSRFAAPAARRVAAGVRELGVPCIYFARGTREILGELASVGATAYGVDWQCGLDEARRALGPVVPLQGNLDPAALLTRGGRGALERAVQRVLHDAAGAPHVFNLGHGVLPSTRPERVDALMRYVRRAPASRGSGEPRA